MAALDAFTHHLLDRIVHGKTYAAALELAGLFLDDAPSQYPREELARHLVALASNVHGTFNWATDRFDLIEELRGQQGMTMRRVASEATVRRHLRRLPPREVEDLVNGILRRLFVVSVARGELQDGYDLILDETTFPFYGLGRNQVTQAPRNGPRETLRTEASRQAMPLPPDKYHATRKGFPYHVLATRFTSNQKTVPLAYVRRRPGFAETTGDAVEALVPLASGLPATRWILMDKWYNSSDAIRIIQDTIRANAWNRTRFLVPVTKQTGQATRRILKTQAVSPTWTVKPRRKPRHKSGPSRSLAKVAKERYGDAQVVTQGPEGERFVLVRDWQVSLSDARTKCNLLLYYRPKEVREGEWVMDWTDSYSWIGFYTNAEPSPETAYAVTRAYRSRWGIEILNKRDHAFMGLSKAQYMHPRDITYGFGLILGALENARRNQVLVERRMRQRASGGRVRGRRANRKVVRTHEVLGELDRQAHGLGPVP